MCFRSSIPFLFLLLCSLFLGTTASGQNNCAGSLALTEAGCPGDDNSPAEKALIDQVNQYRRAHGKSALRISAPLSLVANRRLLDLSHNLKKLTHSWSNCSYDLKDEKTWHCVLDAPRRLKSGYKGKGFETLFRTTTGTAEPAKALESWKKSSLHNSIILNLDGFKDMVWEEIGVAIDGQYAALWFGSPEIRKPKLGAGNLGLGVSYDEAVSGLSRSLAIKLASSNVDSNRWSGTSPDKNFTLDIYGTSKEINEANIDVIMKLGSDSKLPAAARQSAGVLLGNIFPEWNDIEAWLEQSVAAVSSNPTAMKAKVIRKINVEIKAEGRSGIKLLIRPQGRATAYEVY